MCAVNVYLCSNLKAKKEKQIDAYFFTMFILKYIAWMLEWDYLIFDGLDADGGYCNCRILSF